jgi:catechol 2,3-dioxygenase-like lactoylglutathione lyase family enzyme
MIQGLSHMTFIVRDLDRMETLLTSVLGAKKVYDSGDQTFSLSKERFFAVGDLWLVAMEGDPLPSRTYNHIAFKIEEGDYDGLHKRIHALGLVIRESRSRVEGEGRSIYFYDDDNHLFELHTGTLGERLQRYALGCGGSRNERKQYEAVAFKMAKSGEVHKVVKGKYWLGSGDPHNPDNRDNQTQDEDDE